MSDDEDATPVCRFLIADPRLCPKMERATETEAVCGYCGLTLTLKPKKIEEDDD